MMTRYADHDMTEEDLRHLEDEGADTERRDAKPLQTLPEPLYRLEVGHSHETFLAVYEGPLPQTEASAPPAASDPTDEVPADALGEEPESPDPAPADPSVLSTGTYVLANTRYGRDLCRVMGTVRNPGYIAPEEIVHIERIATDSDLERLEQNLVKERQAFSVCQERIAARNLPMKLVSSHYLVEEPKVLFFFTADSRVDFRELVKDLVSVFKMRIELRQIGVRDEARVTGGCGVCGQFSAATG